MAKEKKNIGFQELDDSSVENVSGGYVEHHKGKATYMNGEIGTQKAGRLTVYTNDGQRIKSFNDDAQGFADAMALDKQLNG